MTSSPRDPDALPQAPPPPTVDDESKRDSSPEIDSNIVAEKEENGIVTTDEDNRHGKIMGRSKGKLAIIMGALCKRLLQHFLQDTCM